MKKITTILMLLMLSMGAWAQTATLMEGYGEPLTLTQFKAMANTGQRFGFVASSNTAGATAPRCDHWCGFTNIHNTTTLSDEYLFYLEKVENDTCYKVKRASDNKYVITSTGSTSFGDDGFPFGLINRDPNDVTKAVTGAQSITFKNPNAENWYNANLVKLNNGPGAWTTYAVFGPIYKNITIDCKNSSVQSIEGYPKTYPYMVGGEVTAPTILGKKVISTSTFTVNQDDQKLMFVYVSSNYDYTLVVNGAPEGTTIKIKGKLVKNTTESFDSKEVSFDSAVTESDVDVAFTKFGYSYTVVIEGTTITINCSEPWPVNFLKTQTFTRGDRGILSATFNDQTVDGLYVDQNTLCYQDLTATKTVTLPANATVKPSFNVKGRWQHGFVYIDLNNDGDFTDEGELVAKSPNGNSDNPNLADAISEFTSPAKQDIYRMRIKTDWASEDPGGNTGDAPHDISSNNHIIKNGGQIVDLMLVVTGRADVTYVVVNEKNSELFRETTAVATGTVITTLPEAYQRSLFYTYNTVNESITGNTTVTFTATPKADAPFQFTADTSAPVWYYLKNQGNNQNPNGAYPTYVEGGDPNVTLPTANAENATTSWAFIGNPYSGFQIVNEAAGTSLILGSASTVNASNTGGDTYATLAAPNSAPERREVWTIEASSYATNGFFIRNADGHALNLRNNANLAYWTGGADKGSTFVATKVPTPEEKYQDLIVQLQSIPFGKGVNQYSLTYQGQDYTGKAADIITILKKTPYSTQSMEAAQLMLAGASLNMPKPGFYRIKGEASQKYLTASMAENGKFAMTDATDNTTLFCFTAANGSEDAKLVNYPTGKAASVSGWTWIETGIANANKVEFQDGLTNGGYAIKFAAVHLYDKGNEGSADRGGNLTINSTTDPGYTCWKLEEVTKLPITLKAAECKDGTTRWFATFSAPVAVSEVVGADIHKATDNGSTVKVEPAGVTGIPAGTAVLLVSETDPATLSVEPKVVLGETNAQITTALSPLYACEEGKVGLFFGKGVEGYAGFYKLDSTTKTGGFKAYIADDVIGAKMLDFGNEATGINTIENGAENGAVYNLQGQRVNKAQKGVFIQNGKKVVLK